MIKFNCKIENIEIYDIVINNNIIGSIEYIPDENFIENIYLIPEERGKGYLRKILKYFPTATLLPLPEHIDKFKHLGYEIDHVEGEDVYYRPMVLPALTQK